jgi:hypothetical protein
MNLKSTLYDLFYSRVCRAYARHFVGDKPADEVLRFLCSLQFLRVHEFWPDFARPRRFTEKIWSRMLHDRDPLLTVLSDKLKVRDYVAPKVATDCLVLLLWSGDNPEQIPFDRLPSKFVIKTTHGCGYNILVKDKARIQPEMIKIQLDKWLRENYCADFFLGIEWGYKNVKPSIIVESFIDENGESPKDYKFYCFSGRVEFLTVHFDRFVKHKTMSFDRNFEPHEFRYQFDLYGGECQRPKNYEAMVKLAESLAGPFAFIRVDLYNLDGIPLFGELTPYPGGVSTKFLPPSLDYVLGDKWMGQ